MEQDINSDDEFENEIDDFEIDDEEDDMDCQPEIKVKDKIVNPGERIEWNESLSVDIPEIDELQKKVFELLDGLVNRHEHYEDGPKDAAGMVVELTEYSRYYFSKEEAYLRKCGYPDIDCHSKEHRQFIKNTINLRRQVAEDKKNLSYESVSFLRDWLVNHISHSDRTYIPFIRINNYIEDCRLKR